MKISEILNRSTSLATGSSLGMSPIEEKLIGAFQRLGVNISTQYEIGPFFADIYIKSKNLKIVVECDGEEFHKDKDRDDCRDKYMKDRGFTVVRFTGSSIVRDPIECAMRVIDMIDEIKYDSDYQIFKDEYILRQREKLRIKYNEEGEEDLY